MLKIENPLIDAWKEYSPQELYDNTVQYLSDLMQEGNVVASALQEINKPAVECKAKAKPSC